MNRGRAGIDRWGVVITLVVAGLTMPSPPAARAHEEAATIITDRLPGTVRGVGIDFEIRDSEYLNPGITSSLPVNLHAQSIAGSVLLLLEPQGEEKSTIITLRRLEPNRTYYQYIDDFTQLTELATDAEGSVTFSVTIDQPHAIFIQAQKSTVFLRDDTTGGDCPVIGIWQAETKTCLFTTDTSEVIQFASDGITLDGQGNTFTGWNIYAPLRTNITLKNIRLLNTDAALFLYRTTDSVIENVTIERGSGTGIQISLAQRNRIINSNILVNKIGSAVLLDSSSDTTIANTTVASDVRGINITFGSRNILMGNVITPVVDAIDHSLGLLDSGKGGVWINFSRDNKVYDNRFVDNTIQAQVRGTSSGNVFNRPAPDGGNYWSNFDEPAEGCFDSNQDRFCDAPYVFSGGQDNLPQLNNVAGVIDGPPTVVFIPGLQGSRLYTEGIIQENKLWEPNRNADVEKLWLNSTGESLNPNIQTRDIIDEAFGYNIYKGFITFLDELVTEEVIADWHALPYDWRFDVDAAVPDMIDDITALAESSPTSKITLIAHSNGGLVAKALLQELADQKTAGDSDLIDQVERVVLVASPQLGTPKAIASMLHGFDLDYVKGVVLSEATARRLAEFMPSAFNLLPSSTYFDRVADPVVEFDSSVNGFKPFTTLYGPSIDTPAELTSFLTGGNGAWSKPVQSDVISPNVLQPNFLTTAATNHTSFEQWSPPENIEVIQIAGWGLDTVKTFKYSAKPSIACMGTVSSFCRNGFLLDYRPIFTEDGDETVVVQSAVVMEREKYYVNLKDHNRELFGGRRNRKHADIFEAHPLHNLLKNIFANNDSLPLHVTTELPIGDTESTRLRVSAHSPVSLSVVDEFGNQTGLIPNPDPASDFPLLKEDITNSYYMEFGEGKYIGFDASEPHTITLEGEGLGTFDLELEEVSGDTTIAALKYEDVPVIKGSVAKLTLQTIDTASPLRIDTNGDGTFETTVNPGEQLTASQLIDSLSVMISSLNLKHGDQISTQAHLRNAQKKINDGKNKNMHSVESQLKNVEKTIAREAGKSISHSDAAAVLEVLIVIRVRLGI